MKKIFKNLLLIASAMMLLGSCNFLEPYPNGSYNEDNYKDYPKLIRGFVDKAYNLRPQTYYSTEYIGTDAGSDDAIYTSLNNNMRQFSIGSGTISNNPFSSVWTRDYQAINNVNTFLEDDLGLNTHYLVDPESDQNLKVSLQGDAYALRAWYYYDLLKTFGGEGLDETMYGVPIYTKPLKSSELVNANVKRATLDETVAQILKDCDSALVYIPFNNRDYPGDKPQITPVLGAVRYKCMDQIAVYGLKAMTYLLWASPAFCPDASVANERYEQAAKFAAKVINHKLVKEGTIGFDPKVSLDWCDGNHYDIVYVSNVAANGVSANVYPIGFGEGCSTGIAPSQNLVDAFPMANGYPITDTRSGYDPKKPYEGRDPRFYAQIYYDGAKVKRDNNGDVMYTFDCVGADAPSVGKTSRTCYYIRKFTYPGYNPKDLNVTKGYTYIAFERFEQMCLIFAEAACQCKGVNASIDGITAKQAISYLRNRSTIDGLEGIGASGNDPYLEECAGDAKKFLELVKNEWRICTCFEGYRYYNLRRWTANHDDLSAINVAVKGAVVSGEVGARSYNLDNELEKKGYPSLWNPLPYMDVRRCKNLVQNKGWENWK